MTSVTDLRRLRKDDDGIGLILVIGVSVVVFGLVATALTLAVNALGASQQRSFFESSLASAEDGIDTTLARLQYAYDSSNADFPVPHHKGPTRILPVTPARCPLGIRVLAKVRTNGRKAN